MLEIILTEEQRSAVEMVKQNQVSILTGGPGTGKSTTCKEVIQWARERGLTVKVCAPSGKAAKRVSETTGKEASTIHRLLEPGMDNNFEFTFSRNENLPIDAGLIIMDETSMVSNSLMADFMRAVNYKTKLLFVGDQDQLPSIGAGAVLRDMLRSKVVPHVELTIIQRNAGDIVNACHSIKRGQAYQPSDTLDLEQGKNLRHIEVDTEAKIVRVITELVTQRFPARGYDPIWDIQVISPVNERTLMSCKNLNSALQEKLNSNPAVEGTPFRVGDKAIQIKNERIDAKDEHGMTEETIIVNGDLCQILDVDKRRITAKFFDPVRIVNLKTKENNLLLAYAITCHRYQGSEAPVVIIPVYKSFNFFVTRDWIYTAISRAKQICVTVGQFTAVGHAIGLEVSNKRVTKLEERLRKTCGLENCSAEYSGINI